MLRIGYTYTYIYIHKTRRQNDGNAPPVEIDDLDPACLTDVLLSSSQNFQNQSNLSLIYQFDLFSLVYPQPVMPAVKSIDNNKIIIIIIF